MISPTPVEKQSNNTFAPNTLDSARVTAAVRRSGGRAPAPFLRPLR